MNNMMIKLILLLVFAGWLIVWIMVPTKTYKNVWTPKLQAHLTSTYFGAQGTNLLLFSFPVMFIAALSCVYLHLIQNKSRNSSTSAPTSSPSASFLHRPVIVAAPLGVVTAMELVFGLMFVALLVWSLANYLITSFRGHLHRQMDMTTMMDIDQMWQAKFRSVSLRLGYIGNICWAFLFFPVTRSSSIMHMFGLTSESSIKYHIWLGHLSTILFLIHTLGFIVYWAMTHQMVLLLEWSKTYVSNLAGDIAMLLAMAMWVTSIPRFRRKMFELFYYTHQLYPLYILFYVLHVGASYFCMILPGIFLFAIDRYLRFLQSSRHVALVSARVLPCETLELNFSKSKGLDYNPTSILFINVPRISKLQWHPFTVTSNAHMEDDKLSVVIKCQGAWSNKLYKQLASKSLEHLQVSVEGPYGPTTSHLTRHKGLIMVSGGSGITPMISTIREIISQSNKQDCHLPNVRLICAFKNSADLSMLELLLPISGTPSDLTKTQLQIEAYVTRETQQQPLTQKQPSQTITFKPNPLDLPISGVLSPKSWLWLAAIISTSFLLFLFLLGTVTRFYIYPIVHDDGENYHYSFTCLWYMFLVCASVFLVSSVVFVWCKNQNTMERNQIQNLEVTTHSGDDRELESFPLHHEALIAQVTKVHYGARPNLKKLLLETKGSDDDIGVLACGPKEMRHEVAKLCSSDLAQNLHFESISFNW